MNRRAFLAVSGLAISGGCMNGGGAQTESAGETITTEGTSETEPPTATLSESTGDTTKTEASATTVEESATTASRPTEIPSERLCIDTIQFESLSQDAQEEFTTALEEGELNKQRDEFQLPKEVPDVNDEHGQETCIRYESGWYLARFGEISSDGNVYQLSIHSADGEDTETETPSGADTTGEDVL